MRKILNALLVALPLLASAQSNFTQFTMSYFSENTEYDIMISEKNKALDKIYIDAYSIDTSSKKGTFIIEAKKLDNFKKFLLEAKAKYNEWTVTAKENNVTDFDKDIPYGGQNLYAAGFVYGEWHFDFSVTPKARFRIVDGKYLLIIDSQKLQASDNRYIDSKGILLVFNSDKEIQDLINKLDVENMNTLINKESSKESLFK